jgi:hypothetical protein
MKRVIAVVLAGSVVAMASFSIHAQVPAPTASAPGPGTSASTESYAATFGDFLQKHPGEQGELVRDPSLVRDQAYLDKHPVLKEFLEKHPKLAAHFRNHPTLFMRQVHEASGGVRPY